MSATRGRVVRTPNKNMPYKIVLKHKGGLDTEEAVRTIRDGEARIREETPESPESAELSTLLDRPPDGV
jgi:hypothetical protein